MPDYAGETPALLMKKMGGIALLIVGFLLMALGYGNGSNGLSILGVILLIGGVALLTLKIFRRNPP